MSRTGFLSRPYSNMGARLLPRRSGLPAPDSSAGVGIFFIIKPIARKVHCSALIPPVRAPCRFGLPRRLPHEKCRIPPADAGFALRTVRRTGIRENRNTVAGQGSHGSFASLHTRLQTKPCRIAVAAKRYPFRTVFPGTRWMRPHFTADASGTKNPTGVSPVGSGLPSDDFVGCVSVLRDPRMLLFKDIGFELEKGPVGI